MVRMGMGVAAAAIVWAAPGLAQTAQSYDIAAQDLGGALEEFAVTSGREVVAPSEVIAGRRGNAVKGTLTAEAALERLIAGTGLRYEIVDGAFVVRGGERSPAVAASESGSDGIVVTGTRLRGSAVASPRITLRAETMRDQGLATLTEAARTIPQNFGGGQNPTIGFNVPATSGVNVGGGSSLNLRGMGSDATLTLLNGRRLSYSSSRQSVDLSAIPAAAVDRVEIVTDGSSAIYGSDAVAGVANIILRRDMEGLFTSVRLGGSTDGGNEQRTYAAAAGTRWGGGGSIIAYEYGFNSPIVGRQRSYTRSNGARGLDLLPEIERHSVAGSVHQTIGPISASLDVLYNNRRSFLVYALNAAGDRGGLHVQVPSRNKAFLIAPSVALDLGGGWRTELSGSYGEDKGYYAANVFLGATPLAGTPSCYCNDLKSVELSADGPVFAMPGGDARLAIGGGYRDIGFASLRGANNPQNIIARQSSAYAFGEASLPLLARGDGEALAQLSAAARYERYPDLGDVATPKVGLIVSPNADIDLKASWGRSFRAPTLLQRYEISFALLEAATNFGGSGFPPGSTVLRVIGGRPDLKPEKARSWSITADIHPRALDGTRLEVSYFDTSYRDRIVSPILFSSQALSNPIYADQVTLSPSSATVAATVAGAGQFVNVIGGVFDPARVVAIIDNSNVNAATQRIRGFDGAFTLESRLGDGPDKVTAGLYASYLTSSQQLTDAQPVVPLAGRLFSPPRIRARAVFGWSGGLLGLTGAVNRVGAVTDPRPASPLKIRGMTTVDLTARLRSMETSGITRGLDVVLTAQNLFNVKPAPISNPLQYDNPYDSTNYSPIGRFIALSISKSW